MNLQPRNNYADILNRHNILYMPSCLIVEMMTRLYSQVATINLAGDMRNMLPDLLILLRRLDSNLKVTTAAYRERRIGFFLGDWRDEKRRVRTLFFGMMSRLGYISELLAPVERKLVYHAVDKLNAEWARLDGIMRDCASEGRACPPHNGPCRCFRNEHSGNWRRMMASVVLALNAASACGEGTCLMLLCYRSIKTQLLRAIEELEARAEVDMPFSQAKIMAVSNEDVTSSCSECTSMTNSFRRGGSEIIHRGYRDSEQILRDKSRSAPGQGRPRQNAIPNDAVTAWPRKPERASKS